MSCDSAAPNASLVQAQELFATLSTAAPLLYRAPGRVNLIGEHTDYNDGFVMPAAIDFATYVAVTPRADRKLRIASANFHETVEFDIDHLDPKPAGHWSDYVRGVAGVLVSKGLKIRGVDLALASDVPVGSGLSSSAALEVSTAAALLGASGLELPLTELALACQKAEHVYTGTMCGIMDQYISALGKAGHALKIDCRSLEPELLPLNESATLVIVNTNVKHELASGEYNRRRASCEAGVEILKKSRPAVKALRDVTSAELEAHKDEMDELTYRRCRHVVGEDERVEQAATALKAGDLVEFGKLMFASHLSLRHDYEVSCPELDALVELAAHKPGLYGARMTGGGFGGCTVNLVKNENAAEFAAVIAEEYKAKTGLKADVYACRASNGVSKL